MFHLTTDISEVIYAIFFMFVAVVVLAPEPLLNLERSCS